MPSEQMHKIKNLFLVMENLWPKDVPLYRRYTRMVHPQSLIQILL